MFEFSYRDREFLMRCLREYGKVRCTTIVRRMTNCDRDQALRIVDSLNEELANLPEPRASPEKQFILAFVDLERRVMVDFLEFYLPIDDVRCCLGRPPQINDEWILSWGNVTLNEAETVINTHGASIPESELRDEALEEFRDLMASHASTPIGLSLYYSRRI